MNKLDTYSRGRDRGLFFSDVELTKKQERQIKDIEDLSSNELNSLQDSLLNAANEAEENGREYSPFECLAHEINECPNAEGLWEAFSDGISMGIKKGFKSRFPEVFCGTKRRAKRTD